MTLPLLSLHSNLRPEPLPFHELHTQLVAHEILLRTAQEVSLANLASKQDAPPLLPMPIRHAQSGYTRNNFQSSLSNNRRNRGTL